MGLVGAGFAFGDGGSPRAVAFNDSRIKLTFMLLHIGILVTTFADRDSVEGRAAVDTHPLVIRVWFADVIKLCSHRHIYQRRISEPHHASMHDS